jgi:hypothetical protein
MELVVGKPGARAQTSPPVCVLSIEPHFLFIQSLLAKKLRGDDARESVIVYLFQHTVPDPHNQACQSLLSPLNIQQ